MNNRDSYMDNLKSILIFMVVLGHFLIPVSNDCRSIRAAYYFIYLFHMPAFVFVSGYFSRRFVQQSRKEYKLVGFLSLYVLFTLCLCLVQFIFTHKYNLFIFLNNGQAPWYMLAMFFWYLIIPFVSCLSPIFAFSLFTLLALSVGVYSECGNFLALSRTIVLFPFFIIGFYFRRDLIDKIKPWIRIISAFVLLLCYFILFFRYPIFSNYLEIVYAWNSYHELGFSNIHGILIRIIWYIVSATMTLCLMCLVSAKHLRVTYIGERTLGIYVVHRILRDIFNYLGLYKYVGHGFVLFISCILLSCLIVYISSLEFITRFLSSFFRLGFLMKKDTKPLQ